MPNLFPHYVQTLGCIILQNILWEFVLTLFNTVRLTLLMYEISQTDMEL